jgi:hypothetical protein
VAIGSNFFALLGILVYFGPSSPRSFTLYHSCRCSPPTLLASRVVVEQSGREGENGLGFQVGTARLDVLMQLRSKLFCLSDSMTLGVRSALKTIVRATRWFAWVSYSTQHIILFRFLNLYCLKK